MGGHFPTTRWSVVLGATQAPSPPREKALQALCEAYWRPLYAFVRRSGMSPEDAEDAVQGFLSSLLTGSGIAGVERDRGRFRSYLLAALRHYNLTQRTRTQALKRGGGETPISLSIDHHDAERTLEIADDRTPEQAYAHAWAMEILGRARARLRERFDTDGDTARFEALEPFLLAGDMPRYREVAEHLAMTETNVRVAVHRLRVRFREALREEVADTVSSAAEVDDELRAVIDAVRS